MKLTFFIRFLIFSNLFLIFSCKEKSEEEHEFYQVINVIYKNLAYEPTMGFIPPDPSTQKKHFDSLEEKNLEPLKNSGKIIAIKSKVISKNLFIHKLHSEEAENFILNNQRIFSNLDSIKIENIQAPTNDSVINFDKGLLEPHMSDYLKFDKLISFSQVMFNYNYNKAIVMGTVSTSGLAGSSSFFFLKKDKGLWKVVKVLELEIS